MRCTEFELHCWHGNIENQRGEVPWFSFFRFSFFVFHSLWVGKSYSDIKNPILTFTKSQKILFWHSQSYFDIRYGSEKSYFDIQNPIVRFALSRKIKNLFWHSPWIGKILIWHSKSYCEIRTESENQNSLFNFKILFRPSHWVGKSYFDIQNPISTFAMSRKI